MQNNIENSALYMCYITHSGAFAYIQSIFLLLVMCLAGEFSA